MRPKTNATSKSSRRTKPAFQLVVLSIVALVASILPAAPVLAQEGPQPETPAWAQAPALDDDGDAWSNAGALGCVLPLGITHNAALGASLALGIVGAFYANVVVWGASLGLKYCAPFVEPPPDVDVTPRAVTPATPCSFFLFQSTSRGQHADFAGVAYQPVYHGMGWGDLGSPLIIHWNSTVDVTLREPSFTLPQDDFPVVDWSLKEFPVGTHRFVWRGDTLISSLDSNPIGIIVAWLPLGKAGSKKILLGWLANKVTFAVAKAMTEQYPHGVYNDESQYLFVRDVQAPTVSGANLVVVEAAVPGGADPLDNIGALRNGIQVFDDCDLNPSLLHATNGFWPVGQESSLRWTARDRGPNGEGNPNERVLVQRVQVRDTRPPIFAPPMAVVTETATALTELVLTAPPVFDFADVNVDVQNNALNRPNVEPGVDGPRFPRGKTTVTWTAMDASGNEAQVTQLVNVKEIGANNAPTANNRTGPNAVAAASFEPVTVTLTANDPDADPLWFTIEEQPENGFFIAPLFPYFIEDYRIESKQTDDDIEQVCEDREPGNGNFFELEFPRAAEFVAVDDSGVTYVVDYGTVQCRTNFDEPPQFHRRLAIFESDGGLRSAISVDNQLKDIYIDHVDGELYQTLSDQGGVGIVNRLDLDLELIEQYRTDEAEVPPGENPMNVPTDSVPDNQGILYVTDGNTIRAYRNEVGDDSAPPLLGSVLYGSPYDIDDLAIDSQNNLYVSIRDGDRIHKYGPGTIHPNGAFDPPQLIGWLGKCDAQTVDDGEVHCDVANQRTIGYSCTDDTCAVTDTYGDKAGQFDEPRGIAVDPNDNLYVTDYFNLRVQRFTPEGFYAGQAVSKCGGSCFILGDFGLPEDVTVNSDHFYILDRETNLLHVSKLTPIIEKTDTTAKLVYSSDNNFVGVDNFTFSATDGLATSNMATVAVNVTRNFRPPVARAGLSATTQEDQPVNVTLQGSDPDLPLDTLSYQISTPPAFGTISGNGANRTYTPDPDYFGPDSFAFTVSDGQATSAPEIFELTVTPVNDEPALAPQANVAAGIGYEVVISATLTDGDPADIHTLEIDWGDGTIESEGRYAPETGSFDGPILTATGSGAGYILGSHTYSGPPAQNIRVCVTDSAVVETCETIPTSVSPMADVALDIVEDADPVAEGENLHYTLVVRNLLPDSGGGLNVSGLQLTNTLGEGVTFQLAAPSQGNCNFAAPVVTCSLGALPPSGVISIPVTLTPGASLTAGTVWEHQAYVTHNQPDAHPDDDAVDTMTIVAAADHIVNAFIDEPDANPGDGVCASANNHCSLRAAIEEANAQGGKQTIALSAEDYFLGLNEAFLTRLATTGEYALAATALEITGDLEISGLSPFSTTISGSGSNRVFLVQDGIELTLNNLSIIGGETDGPGGGLLNEGGSVEMNGVMINGNSAQRGGAISNRGGGTIKISNSVIAGNVVTTTGGGISNAEGTVELSNVTISGNQAGANGGGIENRGTLFLTNVTVVGNRAASGGGLHHSGDEATLRNTLVASNIADAGPDCLGSYQGQGQNLVRNAANCSVGYAIMGQDPKLAPLANNGGETLTFALEVGSPAIDTVACLVDRDQRGFQRPYGEQCDIGAFEFGGLSAMKDMFLPVSGR